MRSAIKIFLSLHTQISRAEKQMRREDSTESGKRVRGEGYITGFGFEKLDKNIIGDEKSLPLDACILLKGERGTHKLAVAANYLFQGLRAGENVVLFNMGSPVELERIPQFENDICQLKKNKSENYYNSCESGRIKFAKVRPDFEERDNQNDLKTLCYYPYKYNAADRPPEGKYKLHWWVSNAHFAGEPDPDMAINHLLHNHGNLFILDFDTGFLFPEEFISTLTELWEWIKRKAPFHSTEAETFFPFKRVLLNSTAQIKSRFPVLEEEAFLIPSFIRLTKCYGISSMIIDVLPPEGEYSKHDLTFDALSDLIITMKHNFNNEFSISGGDSGKAHGGEWKILTADNITGKIYEKNWLGFKIDEDGANRIFRFAKAEIVDNNGSSPGKIVAPGAG